MNDETKNQDHVRIITAATAAATAAAAALVGKDIEYIKRDIGEIKTSLKEQSCMFISQTEHADVLKTVGDHEARLRSIERYTWLAIGGLYVINIIIGIYLAIRN